MANTDKPRSSFWPRGGAAKTVVGVIGFAAAAAWYSHYAQKRDRAVMRAGVERDKERLRLLRQKQRRERGGNSNAPAE